MPEAIKAVVDIELDEFEALKPIMGPAAARGAAEALKMYSDPLVPVDSTHLRTSGRIYHTPSGANLEWSGRGNVHNPSKNNYDYAAIQHETETYNHPNGGTDHWEDKAQEQHAGEIQNAAQRALEEAIARVRS